jgi:hypothetical protein
MPRSKRTRSSAVVGGEAKRRRSARGKGPAESKEEGDVEQKQEQKELDSSQMVDVKSLKAQVETMEAERLKREKELEAMREEVVTLRSIEAAKEVIPSSGKPTWMLALHELKHRFNPESDKFADWWPTFETLLDTYGVKGNDRLKVLKNAVEGLPLLVVKQATRFEDAVGELKAKYHAQNQGDVLIQQFMTWAPPPGMPPLRAVQHLDDLVRRIRDANQALPESMAISKLLVAAHGDQALAYSLRMPPKLMTWSQAME